MTNFKQKKTQDACFKFQWNIPCWENCTLHHEQVTPVFVCHAHKFFLMMAKKIWPGWQVKDTIIISYTDLNKMEHGSFSYLQTSHLMYDRKESFGNASSSHFCLNTRSFHSSMFLQHSDLRMSLNHLSVTCWLSASFPVLIQWWTFLSVTSDSYEIIHI